MRSNFRYSHLAAPFIQGNFISGEAESANNLGPFDHLIDLSSQLNATIALIHFSEIKPQFDSIFSHLFHHHFPFVKLPLDAKIN